VGEEHRSLGVAIDKVEKPAESLPGLPSGPLKSIRDVLADREARKAVELERGRLAVEGALLA
jgi:hypothetical protein